ncbi:MAG: hypothetical protein AAF961_06595 [Planctomycetota bacterium]
MLTLAEFLLRLCFGLTLAMALLPPRQVSSGYFRNHLYVALGLSTLAALLLSTSKGPPAWPAWIAAAASYVGSIFWLYEKPRWGRIALLTVAAAALWNAWSVTGAASASGAHSETTGATAQTWLMLLQTTTSGLLLGVAMAAMLLGHWYLNWPGMRLEPLRRLLDALGLATLVEAAICALGLALEVSHRSTSPGLQFALFVTLRWAFGLIGVAGLTWMARETLKIPNTQSATGILYVAVIGTFVGETASLLLRSESAYPL